MGESRGWKLGIIPTKDGRGSIGINDFASLSVAFGNNIKGGGIKCFETKTSWDYYD